MSPGVGDLVFLRGNLGRNFSADDFRTDAVLMHEHAAKMRRAKVEIFGADEGGSHFMFMENPDKFNRVAMNFRSASISISLLKRRGITCQIRA